MDIARLNDNTAGALDLLLSRRSGSAKSMTAPGPSPEQLIEILKAGTRVPDHGKLSPWRFLVFEGAGRERFGEILADVSRRGGVPEDQVEDWRRRFLRAPLVIAVISHAREMVKVPVWEQELSAGAVCQNILLAVHALGFVGNWLTEWYAYHPAVKTRLGLVPGERVAGFIYVGTASEKLEERPRPDLEKIVTYF